MAGIVSLRITGLKELEAGFNAMPATLDEENRLAMQRSVLIVEAATKAMTPRRTGYLQASIHGEVVDVVSVIQGVVGTPVKYGPMIEFGAPVGFPINYRRGRRTRHGHTRPYVAHLRKARVGRHMFERAISESVETIREEFMQALDRVAARVANNR